MRTVAIHLAAAAVALGALSPATAVAQQEDGGDAIGQAIAGAALLGLFGLALREEDEDDDARAESRVDRTEWDGWGPRPGHGDWVPPGQRRNWVPPGQRRTWVPPGHRRDGLAPGHQWEPGRAALPLSCLRQHDTARGPVRLFDGGCLEERYDDVHALPFDCAILLDDHGRLVSGYVPRCLRDDGFEYADR